MVSLILSHTDISLSPANTAVNTSHQLSVTIIPATASNQNIIWASSNIRAATVDQNGRVTAANPGNTTVRVRVDGTNLYAQSLVYVSALPTGLTFQA